MCVCVWHECMSDSPFTVSVQIKLCDMNKEPKDEALVLQSLWLCLSRD